MRVSRLKSILVLPVTLSAWGCVLAAAGAGAGTAILLTNQGVESIVAASMDTASSATEIGFEELAIERTGLEIDDAANRKVYRGSPAESDRVVTVTLTGQESGNTKIEVTARTSALTWDKDYARDVLEKIVGLVAQSRGG
jgi:hypothetical protein